MKKLFFLLTLLVCTSVSAQESNPYATYLLPRSSDPATCVQGQLYFNTATTKTRVCTSANTWSDLGSGGGGTVTGTGTTNTVAKFTGASAIGNSAITESASQTAIKPLADSATAIQLQTASGSAVLNVDTTRGGISVGTGSPATGVVIYTVPTNSPGSGGQLGFLSGPSSQYHSVRLDTSNDLVFDTYNAGWAPGFVITPTRNIGIGTSSNINQTLTVNGNIGLTGSAGTAPDLSVSRLAAGSLALGNGTSGDFSGSLKLTTLNIASGGSTTISTGVGSVKMSTGNAATNTTWIPLQYNGVTVYVPAWATNAP
jgi:hypothetical protein